MRRLLAPIDGWFGVGWLWLWGLCGAAVLHFGTAFLRLGSFFPSPQALDFSSYYAAAWALRLQQSPYLWSAELLQFLAETQKLPGVPPVHNSPPLWPLLLQPLTLFTFPTAATLWLLILLLVVVFCHLRLVHLAGYSGWKVMLATLPITLSFGPLFLNLTLGQNGVFLLLGALLLGETVKCGKRSVSGQLLSMTLWIVAVSAKIYPILWVVALPILQRWRMLASAGIVGVALLAASILLAPRVAADYWLDFLPNQTGTLSAQVGIDDQSLGGFLSRVGRANQFAFPGVSLSDTHHLSWEFPWNLSTRFIQLLSLVLLLLLGLWLVYAWMQSSGTEPDAFVYALVLFSLLPFPHMERYNHILALPGLAWLWGQGGFYRRLAIGGYGLCGLSRLNHFWAVFLPSPFGPIATGFGLFGVLVLLGGISLALRWRSEPRLTPLPAFLNGA